MDNNSKTKLSAVGFTYKEIALLLDITERQALNILKGRNKSLYNYLVLANISNTIVEDLFSLTDDEIKNINKRLELISSLK